MTASTDIAPGVVRFVLDGRTVDVPDPDPTRTVLQYLREDLGRTGTKEGCAEGDCGACTVAVAEPDADGRLRVRAINSCIQFLPTLDGKELITVESLRGSDGTLHPVQQAMADCHGSQCGFCTPGFVMSLFALYKHQENPDRTAIDDAIAGNLCRCTGYRPIIEAAVEMYRQEPRGGSWLLQPAAASQQELSADESKRLDAQAAIRRNESLALTNGNRRYFAPRTGAELADLYARYPDAVLLAGGTDVGLWVTKHYAEIETVIYTGSVAGLKLMQATDSHLEIGAAVTYTDAMPLLLHHFPTMSELLRRFASPPIRNAGTLGGNVANGSPIGDSMPALLALDAVLLLRSASESREMRLDEFYLDYQENALRPGEFIEQIKIPRLHADDQLQSYKVSKRFDQDISAVCGAYRLRLGDDNRIDDVRIAYGGLAAIPKRARACERALAGREFAEAIIVEAMAALDDDFEPITDMRASEDYRRRICKNLLLRFYRETSASLDGKPPVRIYDYGRQKQA
ncbi:MAG: xanthine dehydrogenase small subunit [Woeseia sp.]